MFPFFLILHLFFSSNQANKFCLCKHTRIQTHAYVNSSIDDRVDNYTRISIKSIPFRKTFQSYRFFVVRNWIIFWGRQSRRRGKFFLLYIPMCITNHKKSAFSLILSRSMSMCLFVFVFLLWLYIFVNIYIYMCHNFVCDIRFIPNEHTGQFQNQLVAMKPQILQMNFCKTRLYLHQQFQWGLLP